MSVYGGPQLAAAFRTVRKNTIKIAEDIPESRYDFAPVENTRTVAEQLAHIIFSPRFWYEPHAVQKVTTLQNFDFFGIVGSVQADEAVPRTKAQLVELLRSEGERLAVWLESLPDDFLAEQVTEPNGKSSRSRLETLLGMKEHEMHHRAQLMVIERLVGVVPHLTRQMNEQMEQMQRAKSAGA